MEWGGWVDGPGGGGPGGVWRGWVGGRAGGVGGSGGCSFGGDDRLVSEYLESEFLARVSGAHRAFLTRTAVLTRLSGALCEAVLELPGAAAILADLARSNLLLVPLDRRGEWDRYHHPFPDNLLAGVERRRAGEGPGGRGPPAPRGAAHRPPRGGARVVPPPAG